MNGPTAFAAAAVALLPVAASAQDSMSIAGAWETPGVVFAPWPEFEPTRDERRHHMEIRLHIRGGHGIGELSIATGSARPDDHEGHTTSVIGEASLELPVHPVLSFGPSFEYGWYSSDEIDGHDERGTAYAFGGFLKLRLPVYHLGELYIRAPIGVVRHHLLESTYEETFSGRPGLTTGAFLGFDYNASRHVGLSIEFGWRYWLLRGERLGSTPAQDVDVSFRLHGFMSGLGLFFQF